MVLGAHPIAADAKVRRLQEALNVLGRLKDDRQLLVSADGVLGAKTISATNRAIAVYVVKGAGGKHIPQNWQRMTSSMVQANAAALAQAIEFEAGYIPASVTHDPLPAQQASMIPSFSPSPGGPMNPQQQYYPQSGYAPPPRPGYYPQAPRAGGLPTDRATLDVKTFIPAQYEHISLSPAGGMVIILVGVMAAMLISQHRKATK